MAWNEPGGGNRDPWKNRKDPVDLEAFLRKLRESVGGILGGGKGGSGGSYSPPIGGILLGLIALILVWAVSTAWISIDAQNVGVVLRFGKFERIIHNGLNLKWPTPIERVVKVETTSRQTADTVRMLTKDENIVEINFTVQYQVVDAQKYLFAATAPEETLRQAAESAVRQVIGSSDMDTILSSHGSDIVGETKKVLQATLDGYAVGLNVNEINFQNFAPPHEVKEAFEDVNNASNNQKQAINDAQAYAAKVVPLARGDAARILADAEGYKAAQIAKASGDAQRFSLVEEQYRAAPEVTRKRLYLETMEEVLGRSQKVIDSGDGKNILYLPLDKTKTDAAAAVAAGGAQ
ncbi:MAG: FtsH protease activity modulator HflK [Rudaea sp.]|uniref:FtsH protease activity modulator HflK n=1 Tax=Rudaea sp. TaxID=2136325 RepID=UPI0039E2DD65